MGLPVAYVGEGVGLAVERGEPRFGAYGIPQSLPASKMASAGVDWKTNSATQIAWGLDYIRTRYKTPCGAWAMWNTQGWY